MHSIMANLNLNQDEANERDMVSKSYPLEQAVRIHRYSSLININPSVMLARTEEEEEEKVFLYFGSAPHFLLHVPTRIPSSTTIK